MAVEDAPTRPLHLQASYTLSFADDTGSDDRTTSVIVWIDEPPPPISTIPLDLDRRHQVKLLLDYRLGAREGPELFGMHPFARVGFGVFADLKSGTPYTGIVEPFPVNASRAAPNPSGGINEDRMPWSTLVNLRVDRTFPLGAADLTLYL